MIPYLMTAHEGRSDKSVDGRVVVFPSTNPKDLRVNMYDPLRGVPVAELKVRISYATGKHCNYTFHFAH
ncbi:hypothetical protein Ahos_0458 [Acidianus hospitalis W1]|uniref:Uncharacterized protein n=1 Tax=Acidianus hospitalis (strain W1) TaxID=933801 RepID=F4B658_ACIHW|nr:hypothetical protein Ahos_0458 [Acidianus hospitalis W1]